MINAKQAVQIAKEQAAELLGQPAYSVEEIERHSKDEREVWSITLSFPRDMDSINPVARIAINPLQYKRFLIDAETGGLVAIRLREPVAQ